MFDVNQMFLATVHCECAVLFLAWVQCAFSMKIYEHRKEDMQKNR